MSIPFDFFTEEPQSGAALILKNHFGTYQDFLPQLSGAGVNSIELRSLGYRTDKETVENISRKLWKLGFCISIHSAVPENERMDAYSFLSFLENTLPHMGSFQEDLILVIHSYRGSDFSYEYLLNKSVKAIQIIAEYIEQKKLPLKIALELNRGKREYDPSTSYEGLLELKAMIGHSGSVGFCWDFGHAYSNHLNGIIPIGAPAEFISAVIQTHIHGVSKDDKTHCLLSENNLPLGQFISQLNRAKYDRTFNLEINPGEIPPGANAIVSIKNSITCLMKNL